MMRYPSDCNKKVATAKPAPTPKDTVYLLYEYLGEEDKIVTKKDKTEIYILEYKILHCKISAICNVILQKKITSNIIVHIANL